MISVVIPLYNKEYQIRHTLETLFLQTYQDFEIIIVNDGSTDNSVNEVNKIKDSRIRLYNQTNSGVSAARNRGIQEAEGEFVAFLDADDEWKPNYLLSQYELVQQYPQCDVFVTNYEFKKDNDVIIPTSINKLPFSSETGILQNYFEIASCSHPPMWTSAVMARRECLIKIGGFPVGIKSGEDLLTWAKLACRYKIAYNRNPLAVFNEGSEHNLVNKPSRPHDENDFVADELIKLLSLIDPEKAPALKKYISLWYKMKVSVYVRSGNIKSAWKYGIKSLTYNFLNYKVYLMMFIVLLPEKVQHFIISKY